MNLYCVFQFILWDLNLGIGLSAVLAGFAGVKIADSQVQAQTNLYCGIWVSLYYVYNIKLFRVLK